MIGEHLRLPSILGAQCCGVPRPKKTLCISETLKLPETDNPAHEAEAREFVKFLLSERVARDIEIYFR